MDREIRQPQIRQSLAEFEAALFDDLNTPQALVALERLVGMKRLDTHQKASAIVTMIEALGLDNFENGDFLKPTDLRIRPKSATITEAEIEAALTRRKEARAAKDFATSDKLRDELTDAGVEVMDGDPLGWDWRLDVD